MFEYIRSETARLRSLKSYKNSFVEYLFDHLFLTIYLYQKSLRASTSHLEDRKEKQETENYEALKNFCIAAVEFIRDYKPQVRNIYFSRR